MLHFHRAQTASGLANDLADFVADRLAQALAERGQALLVVSGGRTPVPFFDALSCKRLDWAQVSVTLADERWLSPSHADSNERLLRQHLLQGPAALARFIPMFNGAKTPQAGLAAVNAALASAPWPAAVTVLGMGSDGHTASLFPHEDGWLHALQGCSVHCLAVDPPPAPNVAVPRISLSPQALLSSQSLILHLTGSDKAAVLAQALQGGDVADMPVRLVLHQRLVPCHVFQSP